MGSFKDLIVWQKGIDLTILVYDLCKQLPVDERYGLASQMKRAAVAISSNIAEGHRRNNRKEYLQFCGIALGSAAELETQLLIVSKIYPEIAVGDILDLCVQIQKMLSTLVAKLRV